MLDLEAASLCALSSAMSPQPDHPMQHAFICDAIRTPIGRYGGALSSIRTDDLGAIALRALIAMLR